MIGRDAVNTANAFNEGVDFTGVVLSSWMVTPARWCGAVGFDDRQADYVRVHR